MTTKTYILSVLALSLFAGGCAKERTVKPILANGMRVEKTNLQGMYLFAKTITTSQFNGGSPEYESVPVGRYEGREALVQFKITEKTLDVVAIDPLYKFDRPALETTLLARFPIKHVDVLRKQNIDGEDTHEEEETDTRRPWNERTYVIIDTVADAQEGLNKDTKSATSSENIEIDRDKGAINFTVTRAMQDDSEIAKRYSFLRFHPSSSYVQQEYPAELQSRFGFFKTTTLKFDAHGNITQTDRKEFVNRWDTSKKVVYYLSPNYPQHLIAPTKQVFASWNEAFKAAVGHDVLEVHENSGQQLGDLRYSMITFDDTIDAAHGILGYGPSYANPRTGEIVKADVILYGGVLKRSVYRERIWQKLLEDTPADATAISSDESKLIKEALSNLQNSRLGKEKLNLALLSKVSSLLPKRGLDRELLQAAKTTYHPVKMGAQIRKETLSDLHHSVTRLNEGTMAAVVDGAKRLSDAELEVQIFMPLLAHELGHNLGLRHNFMGSVDSKHFAADTKTASIMDYAFLTSHEGTGPGAYDKAAIFFGYGSDEAKKQKLIVENYFYCTDEEVFSSQNAVCNQFDSGGSLTEITANQFKRYEAGWALMNNRLDRVYFNSAESDYRRRVLMNILPLRNAYDHATALANAVERSNAGAVWFLARQRVEADPSTKEENKVKIKVLSGFKVEGEDKTFASSPIEVEKTIDTEKVIQVAIDAKIARTIALNGLREIVLNEKRPDFAVTDQINGEVQIRGVLFDKIMALSIMAAKLPNPLGDGTVATTFPEGEDEPILPTLFRQVISNIVLPGEPGSPTDPEKPAPTFDINLRDIAIDIIKEELSELGLQSVMRGVLATEITRIDITNTDQKSLADYEKSIRDLLRQLYAGDLSEEQQKEIGEKLKNLVGTRNRQVFFAQSKQTIGERYFKAPIFIEEFGLTTASGLFIRDSINPYEQMGDAMALAGNDLTKVIQAESAKPEAEQNKDLLAKTTQKRAELSRNRLLLGQIVESQKTFLDKMERAFNPN